MKIARVMVTTDCNRDCDLCCNKNLPVKPRVVEELAELRDYDQVLLTGGEPMLYPRQLLDIVEKLKCWEPDHKVYVYSALASEWMGVVASKADGVHFTLHHPLTEMDLLRFYWFQDLLSFPWYQGKSFRLYIEPRIEEEVKIIPSRWSRVEMKPWLAECPLPENEELLILEE